MDWISLAQGKFQWRVIVKMVMGLRVPYIVGIFLTSRAIISSSRRTLLHGFIFSASKTHEWSCKNFLRLFFPTECHVSDQLL